jgi:glycosyltransferase involved in cell wall biosynthesis
MTDLRPEKPTHATDSAEILILQSLIPHYRVPVFRGLAERFGSAIHFACGEESHEANRSECSVFSWAIKLRNRLLPFGIIWQSRAFFISIRARLLICEANLRMPSTWLIMLVRKLLGRPTIGWGHAHGRSRLSAPIRWLLFKCEQAHIAYTETERAKLQNEFPDLLIISAFNACLPLSECRADRVPVEQLKDVLYVGRLQERKKPMLLLRGFRRALETGAIPKSSRLVFVGRGPEYEKLANEGSGLILDGRLVLAGEITEPARLRTFYSTALFSASPGYVGLSATQSFGYGVPMLIAKNEPHSPEIEACREGWNTLFFTSNSETALAETLSKAFREASEWHAKREQIAAECAERYNFEKMVASIAALIEKVRQLRHRAEVSHV